ncbi:MAG: hypothetical protein JNL81_14865 [Hyphomonadaceae bacterium]|nr:hypothetical protein [Hyphomonadaceae bacterium]
MSDSAWVLKGVDPQTRDRAVEDAQRRGISLADYVTNVVLKSALNEQVSAMAADAEPTPAPEPSDFGVRHRFRTLERRLEGSVGSLESALHSLDSSLFDVASRVGELEGLAGDTAHALQQAIAEMAGQLAAVRLHITDVEENSVARDDETAAAHASLSQAFTGLNYRTETISNRVDDAEIVARRADTNAAVLADAHEALKHAVAGDFSAFAQDINERLGHGLRDVAAAADEAAAQADAAVAHLIVELRGVRQSLEQSVADGVDETRRRMHAAFTDAAERMEALSDRVDNVEMISLRANEQLRIQLTDVEDAAQTALEETAENLRQAGESLATDLQRSIQDSRAALESVHNDLASELAGVRERQNSGLQRLKQVDAAANNTANELAALREALLRRISESESGSAELTARVQAEMGEELDTLASRFARHERDNTDTHFTLRAETERVETAVLASLEKLSGDIAKGDAAGISLLDDIRRRVDGEISALADQQATAAARLTVMDLALGAQTQLADRISQVEAALGDNTVQTRVTSVEAQVSTLTKALAERSDDELLARIEDLRTRLSSYENHAGVAADGVNDLVRMLGRVTTQNAEATAKAEDRVHKLEMALADLKLDHLANREKPTATPDDVAALQRRLNAIEQRPVQVAATPQDIAALQRRIGAIEQRPVAQTATPDDIAALQSRISAVEQRPAQPVGAPAEAVGQIEERVGQMERIQDEALETLRADIVRFVTDNDRRLASLEHNEADYNLAAEFDALRRRVEERILGIEQRSVRTLEQVADTVQMLEERFIGRLDGERQTA